jgi:hypothetical protein
MKSENCPFAEILAARDSSIVAGQHDIDLVTLRINCPAQCPLSNRNVKRSGKSPEEALENAVHTTEAVIKMGCLVKDFSTR